MALKNITYMNKTFPLSYELCNLEVQNPHGVLVFLHGWGSNKELMKQAFDKSFSAFLHCYIDLPGFGSSPCEEVLHTSDYANIIESFLRELQGSLNTLNLHSFILVGHSFGGKIAILLTNTLKLPTLILLSSAGILTPKSLKIRAKIALAKIAKSLGLNAKSLRSKDADNLNEAMYQTFKNVVNEDFSEHFKACNGQGYVFWGAQDDATPLSSGEKIASLIPNAHFFVLDGGHYFFLNQANVIQSYFMNTQNTTKESLDSKNLLQSSATSQLQESHNVDSLMCLHILVYGKVQGVGYRKFAKAKADELGIKGSTQNLEDGSVEIYAQAKEQILQTYCEILKKGPMRANVSRIESKREDRKTFSEFSILRG